MKQVPEERGEFERVDQSEVHWPVGGTLLQTPEQRDREEITIVSRRLCLTNLQLQRGLLPYSLADGL